MSIFAHDNMSQAASIPVALSCLCGLHKHTYAFPPSLKCLEFFVCHCNSCRKASGGSLYSGAIVWPFPLLSVSETDKAPKDPKTLLKHYSFGPKLDFWFCESCSTKMYWQYKKDDAELEIFPGLLPESLLTDHGVELSCIMQVHVEDTLDEGLSRCFRDSSGGIGARRQAGTSGSMYRVPEPKTPPKQSTHVVEGDCHCGKVSLTLRGKENQRYPVELDTSEEGKLLNSVDVSSWAIVGRCDIFSINRMPLHVLETAITSTTKGRFGPLSMIQGSSEQKIYFCNGCGASVFMSSRTYQHGNMVKIGAGLLKSQTGARAEDILDWDGVQPLELTTRRIQLDPKAFRTT